MAASAYLDQVQKLYIAYFGRPADPTGLTYWANQVDAAGGNIAVAIIGFAASGESSNLFGGLPSAQKISAIYLNLFNRPPESTGLSYWMSQLDSGAITQAQAAWELMNQAGAGDATSVANKLAMANVFTARIVTSTEVSGYNGAQPAAYGRAYLAGVDATQASVSNATNSLNSSVADATGVRPSTTPVVTPPAAPMGDTVFTFTTKSDSFTGGAGNDTFIGVIDTTTPANTTVSKGDSIDGGNGTDTLSITVTGTSNTSLPGLSIKNVEKLSVRDQNTSVTESVYDVSGTSIIDVASDVSTASGGVQFVNLSTGATLSLLGDKSNQVANVRFSMANANDTVSLVLNGGLLDTVPVTGQTTVTNVSGTASTATITSSGAANTLGVITLAGSATNSITAATINANADLTAALVASDYASKATLTVTGAGKVDLGRTIGFDGSVIDASAHTGGLTIALGGNIQTFTGGKGNDTVVGTIPVADTAVIDGGFGVDTLSAILINGTNGAAFKNFEVLDLAGLGNTVTQDLAQLSNSSIAGVILNNQSKATTVLNNVVNTVDGFNITLVAGSSGSDTTLNFTNASVAGSNDVLNLTYNPSNPSAQLGKLTAQGIETINITSTGGANTYSGVNLVDDSAKLINITGNQNYALSVLAQGSVNPGDASQLTTVDASKATGEVTFNVAAATATGGQAALNLIGGSGNDTFLVFTSAVANSSGVTVTTNGGNDTVSVASASLRDVSMLSKMQYTTITDFTAGDSIQMSSNVTFQNAAVNVSTANGNLQSALVLATSANVNNYATWFQLGGATYLAVNKVAGDGLTADDIVVKLLGTIDLANMQNQGGLFTL